MGNIWKTILIVIVALVCVAGSLFLGYVLIWAVIAAMFLLHSSSQPNPPKPAITSGRFPFHVEYEVVGQRQIIQDALVCSFSGFGADCSSRGKYRGWNQDLESGNKYVTLLEINEDESIIFDPGTAGYYMGEPGYAGLDYNRYPPKVMKRWKGSREPISPEALQLHYNLRIIGFHLSDPIQNTFK
jgi:hypothetical protein